MNFWRQTTHIMSYFKEENFRGDKRLPSNFMSGFLEVSSSPGVQATSRLHKPMLIFLIRVVTKEGLEATSCI